MGKPFTWNPQPSTIEPSTSAPRACAREGSPPDSGFRPLPAGHGGYLSQLILKIFPRGAGEGGDAWRWVDVAVERGEGVQGELAAQVLNPEP